MATFYNQATLSYNGTVTNSNVITGELLEVLSGDKQAVGETYTGNEDITYVISMVNSGTVPLTGISVTDNLGAYQYDGTTVYPLTYVENTVTYYVNGTVQSTPAVTAGPPLVISGLNIPAGGNAILLYRAQPNAFAPPQAGAAVTNVAAISGTGLQADLEVSETVTAADVIQLGISKSMSPSVVTENGQLTYTFVIQNTGNVPAEPEDNVMVTDTFNPMLQNLTVTWNGSVLTENTQYTYEENTGAFATVAGMLTVPAASYSQETDGRWVIDSGVGVLQVTGTV